MTYRILDRDLNRVYIFTLIIVLFFGYSCNTTKKKSTLKEHQILIELSKNNSGKYITENYKKYNPSSVALANKTLNQYRTTFSCSEKDFDLLLEQLSNDSRIIKYSNQQLGKDKQQYKNTNHTKTKSIRDNN